MPRTCLSGAAWPLAYRGQVLRLAQIYTDVATHYFGEDETDYAGHHYLPGLIVNQPVHRYRSLQSDRGGIALANTLALEALLFAEKWDGALVIILECFTALEPAADACEIARGLLTNRQASDNLITWDMIPVWDPQQVSAPPRNFSRTCTWRFKSDPCGYTSTETDCDKTFARCTVLARTFRFNGFLQVNSTLESTYPGSGTGKKNSGLTV